MLKFKLKTLEGLSEVEQSHYKKAGDEYVLDLDVQIKTDEDVRKLSDALSKERADHKETRNKLSAYNHSPEEFEKLSNEVEEYKLRAGKIDESKISELVSLRVKPFEKEKENLTNKLNEAQRESESLKSKMRDMELEGTIRSVTDGLVDPLSVQDAILRGKAMLSYNEEKGGFFDRDGSDAKEWIEKVLPTTNWGLKGSGGGARGREFTGGKASVKVGDQVFDSKNNPFAEGESFNLTHQSLILKADPEIASQLAEMAKNNK